MQAASGATVVVVAYRPKPGKEAELPELTREHVELLRNEGLATERPVVAATTADGTVVEVFEWAPDGVERAHSNPVLRKLWERYADACEIVPLNQLAESSTMFASFTPIDLRRQARPTEHGLAEEDLLSRSSDAGKALLLYV